ncbi:PREDICTED: uncharacterized protein LOC108553950 [Eufriesea mexicana]|uniref:uncharacterized protein LOC108553950 n=1 Tax=Eufriesea mexicana TaxID=516756 RepID=UPI00083C01D6|nr:PREDICTED: uncharacterized protein LOC108553950 [Eufriesea mexicana]
MRNLMEKQLSWLALLVTTFYSLLGSCRSQECGHERLTMCGRPLEKINKNDFSFAVTKESLQQMCPDFEASLKCIQSYSFNCLQQKQRVRFNQWYTSTNMAIMEMCQEGPFQDKFLQYLPCMQKVEPEYELCYRKFEKTAQNVSRTLRANLNDTVKSLCCGVKEFLVCSYHASRRRCDDDTAQFAKDLLNRMMGLLLRILCPGVRHLGRSLPEECVSRVSRGTGNIKLIQFSRREPRIDKNIRVETATGGLRKFWMLNPIWSFVTKQQR